MVAVMVAAPAEHAANAASFYHSAQHHGEVFTAGGRAEINHVADFRNALGNFFEIIEYFRALDNRCGFAHFLNPTFNFIRLGITFDDMFNFLAKVIVDLLPFRLVLLFAYKREQA